MRSITSTTPQPASSHGEAPAEAAPSPDSPGSPAAPGRPALPALVGNTPLLRISEPLTPAGHGFWAKLEGFNPGGIKDRTGLYMVERARARGELRPGARIVESTSGTLGLGLALAGMVYGHPVTLVTDPGLEPSMTRLLGVYGAEVDIVTDPHPTGGWQQARRDRVTELLDRYDGSWCPDQYNNPDNTTAYTPLALELASALGHIDMLVCSVGTGGHSAGVGRVLRQLYPDIVIVGVDTVGSTIFGQPARPRLMRGLGSSIHPRNVAYDTFDEVHWVAPHEAVWTCRRLAASHYATGGWSVGAVALVASWLARTESADTRIAAVFPDGPQRYLDTVYDDEYCARHGLLAGPPAPEPEVIGRSDEKEVTHWTRCADVVDPLTPLTPRTTGGEGSAE
ncbi:PLP-dependent cysteine synthase family protein [Streptomyces griseiscabiei]|uniref:PLP-dependent cysteine synthase family protein n=2 Tax=Streptomyces griseiscabiei TaxID=2993540 RepID=A0ABU4L305_9ACTN|nr:PLP-dependent cysteine synthase family protein [Streptomyces griseiscabiei]MBZ3901356.1 PLP-dependent cysteine synthase family protein [Streptomyces griseiscabiei]MDX2910093.1 PLP-dependent cysteine synthase family protein [Streptomyces griseiscabiei]